MLRALLGLSLVAVLTACCAAAAALLLLTRIAGPLPESRLTYIAPGSSVQRIARQMEDEGAVRKAFVFRLAALTAGKKGPLRAGEYMLPTGVSAAGIVKILQSGQAFARSLTVPEGLTSAEIVALVHEAEMLSGTVTEIPPEGSLLPETYHYHRGDERTDLIRRMQRDMARTLATLWQTRDPDLAAFLKTPADAVTLAAIVEKETAVPAERARVAGVFANRLRIGMPLQSDPTVIYALTQGKTRLDRPLTRKDLTVASPYNTYTVRGLPPGPIANPGRAAIAAVLAPEKHDYLYFVADGSGGHAFARDLAGHNANVAKWRAFQKRMPEKSGNEKSE